MNQNGFTLLEILIVLAIFALLSTAISGQTQSGVRALNTLDVKIDASLIAENYAERQVELARQNVLASQPETLTRNGRRWRVEQAFTATARADMKKFTVTVFAVDSESVGRAQSPAAELTGYVFHQEVTP